MTQERVLVVDDDEDLLRMMALALRRGGYDVDTAPDGAVALEKMRDEKSFAVLLTDLMMPNVNGLELMREARRMDPLLEVVVITAAATLDSAISALRADGAYDYLLKPLESMSQLTLAIERAAAHRQLVLEREALRAKVQAEAERLQALIANTGDAILSADVNGVLTIVNPAANRLLEKYDLVGKPALEALAPPLPRLISNWQSVSSQHPAVIEIPWKNNTIQMVSLTPIKGKEGNPQGWVIVIRDITHLKDLDALKSNMLADAVRKIQMPLAHAVNDLALLNNYAAKDEDLAETVFRLTNIWGAIQEWGDGLSALVEIDTSKAVQLEDVDIVEILKKTRDSVRKGKVKDAKIHIDLIIPSDVPQVRADPDLLGQLFNGLVKRAALRSDQGGEVRVRLRIDPDQVWVEVSDDGPPVSDADLPHIFERFYTTLEADLLTTGLELATVKTIMDRMGGQVWIGGEGPIGTTVTICLLAVPQGDNDES
jgi:PAS domain S-box-containing protein